MTRLYVNNFSTTLNGSITNVATSITVTDGSGLGTIGGSDFIACTIDDNAGNREIVHVTARSGNNLTVTRGQEGTTGQAFASGITIEGRLTADGMDEKLNVADTPPNTYSFISSQTASSSASLNFTGLGDYSFIKFVITDIKPATDNVRLYLRTSTNNGSSYDSSAGNYSYVFQGGTTGGSDAGTTGSSSATEIHLCTGVGNDTNEWVSGEVTLYNPAGTAYTVVHANMLPIGPTGVLSNIHGGGMRISAADVDAVSFLFASGNIASGVIYAYGLSKT
jgi:hypothetical protein